MPMKGGTTGVRPMPDEPQVIQHIIIIIIQMVIEDTIFSLPSDYPKVVCVVLGLNVQLFFAGLLVGKLRYKLFNQEFMRGSFNEEHKAAFGTDIPAGGFPDTGTGYYSKKLSYKSWYDFNVRQRVHLNFLEGITLASFSILAAGIYKPKLAVIIGSIYAVGRTINCIGALKYKPKMRSAGFAMVTLSVLAAVGTFVGYYMKWLK